MRKNKYSFSIKRKKSYFYMIEIQTSHDYFTERIFITFEKKYVKFNNIVRNRGFFKFTWNN